MNVVAFVAIEMALLALLVSLAQRLAPPAAAAPRRRRPHAAAAPAPPHVEQRIEIALAAVGCLALSLIGAVMWLLFLRLLAAPG